jgi:hypothetical protein
VVANPLNARAIAPDLPKHIQTNVQTLPVEQQQLVLAFVEFLAQKKQSHLPPQTIWEKIRERAARIPAGEWENMPTDGFRQHDHYLYGTPKQEP